MPTSPLFIVDAFAEGPFSGNPAAVCLLDAPADPDWMQRVAAELNLSETAFLSPEGEAWRLRWFTPAEEVDLCGHATLASAHVLSTEGHRAGPLRFLTRSGLLTAEASEGRVTLDFPADVPAPQPIPEGLAEALGCDLLLAAHGGFDWLVEVADVDTVRCLDPDFRQLARVPVPGVIVTAAGTGEADFVSRFFAPRIGIDEDPVTGSAHCTLAPFWAPRLGRTSLVGHQLSARGGRVEVALVADRARLTGGAVTVLEGRLRV